MFPPLRFENSLWQTASRILVVAQIQEPPKGAPDKGFHLTRLSSAMSN